MASGAPDFAKLVPGFDFLQSLVQNAGSVLPNIGQWVAPTLNPEELDKRIGELRTVQFWLEQNARMLGATIQALEVQRMTLSTLQTMNVQVADLRDALSIRLPEEAPADAGHPAAAPTAARPTVSASWPRPPAEAPAPPPRKRARARKPAGPPAPAAGAPAAGAVDPMQWWGALTKQFTELAANAMHDVAADAARGLAAATQPAATQAAATDGDGGAARRAPAADAPDAAAGPAEAPSPRRRGGAQPAAAAERPASPGRKRAPARNAAPGPRGG